MKATKQEVLAYLDLLRAAIEEEEFYSLEFKVTRSQYETSLGPDEFDVRQAQYEVGQIGAGLRTIQLG